MAKIDSAKIIADYKAAYALANGNELEGSLRYEHGWFVHDTGKLFSPVERYRAAAIKDMTARLLQRAPTPAA